MSAKSTAMSHYANQSTVTSVVMANGKQRKFIYLYAPFSAEKLCTLAQTDFHVWWLKRRNINRATGHLTPSAIEICLTAVQIFRPNDGSLVELFLHCELGKFRHGIACRHRQCCQQWTDDDRLLMTQSVVHVCVPVERRHGQRRAGPSAAAESRR